MKLRKCPVCGKPMQIDVVEMGYCNEDTAILYCECGLQFQDETLTTEELIKKWNGNEEVEEELCEEFTITEENCKKINTLHKYLSMLLQIKEYGVKSIKITSDPLIKIQSLSNPANFDKEELSLVEFDIASILEFRIENAASEAFGGGALPEGLFVFKPYELLNKFNDFGKTGTPEDSDPIAIIMLDCDNNFGMLKKELKYKYYPQRNKLERV